ncbi:RNA-directed DNA polymerase, eukaryota, reverse transcriptase zinc-binding domain protein [Tanacetum coccineum]|uniref:RNA-directed DNA polymerase, eukaryota, reverse transcriptase zinc-binding domain protein n=1 Tax=Tanacetum coccineum TaxID=301880 RepID=A0ABQ5BDF1_9ASTR
MEDVKAEIHDRLCNLHRRPHSVGYVPNTSILRGSFIRVIYAGKNAGMLPRKPTDIVHVSSNHLVSFGPEDTTSPPGLLFQWAWRREPRTTPELEELANLVSLLSQLHLTILEDTWECSIDDSRCFTVKGMRSYIMSMSPPASYVATRWNRIVPLKVNINTWRVMNGRMATRSNLDRRGVDLDSVRCPLCDDGIETEDHIFVHCKVAKELWSDVLKWWRIPNVSFPFLQNLVHLADHTPLGEKFTKFFDVVVQTTIWSIWRYRNNVIFSAKKPSKDLIFNDIKMVCIQLELLSLPAPPEHHYNRTTTNTLATVPMNSTNSINSTHSNCSTPPPNIDRHGMKTPQPRRRQRRLPFAAYSGITTTDLNHMVTTDSQHLVIVGVNGDYMPLARIGSIDTSSVALSDVYYIPSLTMKLASTSCTDTPQKNGVTERKHRHLVKTTRSFLLSADVPSVFWGEAVLTATNVINRISAAHNCHVSPFEKLYGIFLDYSSLLVFGFLFIASVHRLHEPESYREVGYDPLWQVAMVEELVALHQTHTLLLLDPLLCHTCDDLWDMSRYLRCGGWLWRGSKGKGGDEKLGGQGGCGGTCVVARRHGGEVMVGCREHWLS